MQKEIQDDAVGLAIDIPMSAVTTADNTELYEIIVGMVADLLFDYDICSGVISFLLSDNSKFDKKVIIPEYSTKISGRIHGGDRSMFERMLRDIKNGKEYFNGECRLLLDSGDYCWTRIEGKTYLANGKAYRAVGRIYGIDREKKESLKLYDEAKRDPLTKLFNKIHSQEMIQKYLLKGRYKHSALFIIDVDNFKNVNDTMGHMFGDDTLASFSKVLSFNFCASDIVGRIGGDEFIAFMKDVRDIEAIRNQAERVCEAICNIRKNRQQGIKISSSIGISVYPEHGMTYEELFQKADQALYYTKGKGKNGYTIYGEKGIN